MTKLALRPVIAGYSATRGEEAISVKLDGGRPRIRKDVLNASSRINVSWILTTEEFNYMQAFYRTTVEGGSLSFTIDLVIDTAAKQTYTANFVPGSFNFSRAGFNVFNVSAELDVNAIIPNAVADAALVAAYNTAHGVP